MKGKTSIITENHKRTTRFERHSNNQYQLKNQFFKNWVWELNTTRLVTLFLQTYMCTHVHTQKYQKEKIIRSSKGTEVLNSVIKLNLDYWGSNQQQRDCLSITMNIIIKRAIYFFPVHTLKTNWWHWWWRNTQEK